MKKLFFMTATIFLFVACKKEEIKKSSTYGIETSGKTKEFSNSVKVYEKNNPDSYVLIEMTSADEKLISRTSKELQNSFIELIEGNPDDQQQNPQVTPEANKQDSIGIAYHLDWTNFKFKEKQNKLFVVSIQNKNNIAKAMTYYTTLFSITSFTSTMGYCIIEINNTYSWWNLGCFCRTYQAWWSIYNQPSFNSSGKEQFQSLYGKNDNIQYRTFGAKYFELYKNGVLNNTGNYDGTAVPIYGNTDDYTNRIKAADGVDYNRGGTTPATVLFWVML